MTCTPTLQSGPSLGFCRRARDLDQRHGGPAPPSRTDSLSWGRRRHLALRLRWSILTFAPGELDAGGLAFLLGEMGWPGSVAESGRLVLAGKLEQWIE